jgi:hypothetical protein
MPGRHRQLPGRGGVVPGEDQRGVGGQDLLLQQPQLRARIHSQLAGQHPAHILIGRQRITLPAAAVQPQHQLGVKVLPQRVGRHQLAQLGHHLTMAAQRQIGIDPRP